MSTPDPSHSRHTQQALRVLAREQKEAENVRKSVWSFVWAIFAFKVVTIFLVWYAATGSGENFWYIVVTTWYWALIPAIALAGPLVVRWRMFQMRRRREELRRREWERDGGSPSSSESIQIIVHPASGDDGTSMLRL